LRLICADAIWLVIRLVVIKASRYGNFFMVTLWWSTGFNRAGGNAPSVMPFLGFVTSLM